MEIRQQITELLVQRIGRHRYDLWFTSPNELLVARGKILICANDAFSLGRIRAQFDDDLRQIARHYGGLGDDVDYEVTATGASQGERQTSPVEPKLDWATSIDAASEIRCELPSRRRSNGRTTELLSHFVFGRDNVLAENGIKQVVAKPGQISPLYLHGPVGSGKSTLLNRLLQANRSGSRRGRGLFVSAEQFTSQFVEAVNGRGMPIFRRKYRDLDFLAIDDLQFFNSKRATLVEFQSTVDHFLREGKQLVLASDRPPSELRFFSPELLNRISSGLVCRVNYPCAVGRTEILQRACAARELEISGRFLGMIAERLPGDVRQLLGAVNILHAAQLARCDLNHWPNISKLLHDIFQANSRPISIESIEQAVCDVCGVAATELRSPKRTKRINVARNLAMWLSRKHTGHAFSEIGLHYGGRSHSTVISAQQKVSCWLQAGTAIPLAGSGKCSTNDAIQRIEAKLRVG